MPPYASCALRWGLQEVTGSWVCASAEEFLADYDVGRRRGHCRVCFPPVMALFPDAIVMRALFPACHPALEPANYDLKPLQNMSQNVPPPFNLRVCSFVPQQWESDGDNSFYFNPNLSLFPL